MQIRINGSANLSQVRAEFAALEAQVTGLNAAMAKGSKMPAVNPKNFQQYTNAVEAGSQAFRSHLASSGAFRVEQMKLNSATSHYTELLQRQKLSFSEVFGAKNKNLMHSIYQEQLKLRDLQVRPTGKQGMFDVSVPMAYRKELDNNLARMNMLGAQLKSAGTHMVNFGKNTQWAGRQLTVGLTMPVVALGAASAVMAYKVDQQMTRVRKVYNTTADQSSKDIKDMTAVTKEFSDLNRDSWNTVTQATKDYGSSATDTLGVQAELAAAGKTGASLQKYTTQVMKSAMLGEIDYQTATTATIALQQQLHLSTTGLSDSWNYMNSVENATTLQMKDFAAAIPIALGPIRQMGGDLQDLGTIMTAMISRGVQVGKAANAIKALPQRLSRPSKQVQEEFKALTGQDIVELNKKNPNNIIGLLTDIENATKNLDTLSRRKALAGLFGTFQLSTMSAMLAGMDDLQHGIGQTTKAFEIGQQSTKEWAQVSNQEIKQMQESLSQRFKTMVNDIKNASVEFGRPFLEIGIKVGSAIVNIMEAFNKMPKALKILAALGIGIAALAGPALMLIGLFANLAGNALKGAGAILSMGKALTITTAAERAMAVQLANETKVMATASEVTASHERQLQLLAQANDAATAAMMEFMLLQKGEISQSRIAAATTAEETAANEANIKSLLAQAAAYEADAKAAASYHQSQIWARTPGYENLRLGSQGREETVALQNARNSEHEAAILMNREHDKAKNAAVVATNSEKTAKEMAKTNKFAAGAAMSTAAMGASMVMMMGPFNENTKNAGQILMMVSMLTPLLKVAGGGIKIAAANMWALAAGTKTAAAGARAFGKAMMSSIGLAGAGIALIVGSLYVINKLWQRHKDMVKEQEKENALLTTRNSLLADELDVHTKMSKLKPPTTYNDKTGKTTMDLASDLTSTDAGKTAVKAYKAGDAAERAALVNQQYIKTLQGVGGSAEKAEKAVAALYIAAGDGMLEAEQKARELGDKLGSIITPGEQSKQWVAAFNSALDESEKAATKTGTNIGAELGDAMAREMDHYGPEAGQKFVTSLQSRLKSNFLNIFKDAPKQTQEIFKKMGLSSAEEFAAAAKMNDKELMKNFGLSQDEVIPAYQALMAAQTTYSKELKNSQNIEAGIAQEIADQIGVKEKITSLAELQYTWEYKLLTISKQQALGLVLQEVSQQKQITGIGNIWDMNKGISDEQQLQIANQALAAKGLKTGTSLAEAMQYLTRAAAGDFVLAADNIDGMNNKLKGTGDLLKGISTITQEQRFNIYKSSMEGVKDDVANALQAGFDAQQQASTDSLQKTWDKRLKVNDRNAERETNRLDAKWVRLHKAADAKWERRKDAMTSYWDKRIENVDNAIDAEQKADDIRQKIFEAEKTRMERLAQMANTNIDFNVAINSGNLDEAAKIKNDMQATAADWALSDAGTASEDASKKRIDALNTQKDALDKQKDAALKNLDILEKANQESLDTREKQEKKHLDRVQKARDEALKTQQDNAQRALADRQRRESMAWNNQLELFKSYTAKDEGSLKDWMAKVGVSFDDFGKDFTKKGEGWNGWYERNFVGHMKTATQAIISDNMWADMGSNASKNMFHAMGFKGMREFANFIKNGTLPNDYGNRDLNNKAAAKSPLVAGQGALNPAKPRTVISHHIGGEVGVDGVCRIGVARSLKGLHPTETLINAQKGEFIVNRRAAQEFKPLLHAINGGRLDSVRNVGNGVGGDVPVSGLAMGIGSQMLIKGIGAAMAQKVNEINAANTVSAGGMSAVYAALKGGKFGGRAFDTEQLGNAAIIAEVGDGMGMNKRDIEIGIMTAITESGLRNLHGGDRDSQGLFQQRPSQGWGSVDQVTNPRYAANSFFSHLKALANRGDMSPWMAAQQVQRSAFSDGSNYKPYWDDAIEIFTRGLTMSGGGFTASGGTGGYQRASIPGKGWVNSHDYRNGLGSPLFAADDGRIIESRAITSGGSPGNGLYGGKYRSFGETIVLLTKDGDRIRYAHLNPNTRAHTGPVKGGALIGRSGMTGNATGPHTHFEINGMEIAREWFKQHGIGLDTGGYTTTDGIANLHKDEVVISADRTNALYNSLDQFSSIMDSAKNIGNGTGGDTGSTTDFGVSRLFGVGDQTAFTPDTNTNQNPVPGATPAKKNSTIRTATFNAHAYGHTAAKSEADLRKVLPRLDAVALQEFTNGDVHRWLKTQGFGVYQGPTGDAIAWRKAKFDATGLDSFDLNTKYKMPKGTSQRYAVYGKLKDKATGNQFWQTSVHFIPGAGYYKGRVSKKLRASILDEQYDRLNKLDARLRGSAPVVVGGDFNDTRTNMLKGLHSTSPGGSIDQIYSNLKQIGDTSKIANKNLASDHAAWFSQFNLPALKTGGYTMSDGLAQLHQNELVVDPARTKVLLEGIDNFASGSNATYNVHMNVNGDTNVDELVNKTIVAFKRMEARKPQSRRG